VYVPPSSWRPTWFSVSSAVPSWFSSQGKNWLKVCGESAGEYAGSPDVRGSGNTSAPTRLVVVAALAASLAHVNAL